VQKHARIIAFGIRRKLEEESTGRHGENERSKIDAFWEYSWARGPATTDQQSILVFLQSPEVETLGITVVSGDMWRDEEVAHTLRMLELIGRTDIPVVPGAVFPLINREELILRWEQLYGKVSYKGAWNRKPLGDGIRSIYHGPFEVPQLVEGNPTTKPSSEDAAHFIIRMVTHTRMR
jgi:purine nucleosidase